MSIRSLATQSVKNTDTALLIKQHNLGHEILSYKMRSKYKIMDDNKISIIKSVFLLSKNFQILVHS